MHQLNDHVFEVLPVDSLPMSCRAVCDCVLSVLSKTSTGHVRQRLNHLVQTLYLHVSSVFLVVSWPDLVLFGRPAHDKEDTATRIF